MTITATVSAHMQNTHARNSAFMAPMYLTLVLWEEPVMCNTIMRYTNEEMLIISADRSSISMP